MPVFEVTAPDGRVFEVTAPEGATPDQVLAHVQQASQQPAAPVAPADNSSLHGLALGMLKPVDNAARALAGALPEGVTSAIDSAGAALGMPSQSQAYDANQAAREANTAKGSQIVGNIAGTLPTLAIPGGALAQGAAGGALLSDANDLGGVAKDTALGAVGGAVGQGIVSGVGKTIAPKMAPIAQYLKDLGVPLTLGQIVGSGNSFAGKTLKAVEDKFAGTFPVLGDAINSARTRGIVGFNRAVVNNVLEPLGVTLPDSVGAGQPAFSFAKQTFNKAYDGILSRMHVLADDTLTGDVQRLAGEAAALPGDMSRTFQGILAKHVDPRFDKASGVMNGRDLKLVDRDLRAKIKSYRTSTVAADREFADVLEGLKTSLLDAGGRTSGKGLRDALGTVDSAYRNFVVLRSAGKSAAAREGVFTPNQLITAVRGADSSVGKGATAAGTAPMQKLATAGSNVLPSAVGDSGTAGRMLTSPLAAGAGIAAGMANPAAAGAAIGATGLASLPYTKLGQKSVERLFSPGPLRQASRNYVERVPGAPIGSSVIAAMLSGKQ